MRLRFEVRDKTFVKKWDYENFSFFFLTASNLPQRKIVLPHVFGLQKWFQNLCPQRTFLKNPFPQNFVPTEFYWNFETPLFFLQFKCKKKLPLNFAPVSHCKIDKTLKFSNDINKSIKDSNIIFICVGTPTDKNTKNANLKYVYQVARSIKKNLNKYKIIVTKSTVPITTGDKIEKILNSKKIKTNLM